MKRSFSLFFVFVFVLSLLIQPTIIDAENDNVGMQQEEPIVKEIDKEPEEVDLNQKEQDVIPEDQQSIDQSGIRIEPTSFLSQNNKSEELKTNRFIFKFKDASKADNVFDFLKSKIKKRHKIKNQKFEAFTTRTKLKKSELLALLKMNSIDKEIEYIQPDYEVNLSSNDSYFNQQWGIYNPETVQAKVTDSVYGEVYMDYHVDANVVPAWNVSEGEGAVVGIIDTGIDINHEDLAENIWANVGEISGNGIDDDGNGYIDDVNGWNFYDENNTVCNSVYENEEHGTHIAGIIAAVKDNEKGIAGVAPRAKIMPLKVFKNGTAYTSNIIAAIEYAEGQGVKIINCSWGTSIENPALKEAMQNSNMLFVCAAGNSGVNIDESPIYPASYDLDNIITVGSINKYGALSNFSNYGVNSVDVAAPGEGIYSILPGNGYGFKDGTSMAAGFVSGEAALAISKDKEVNTSDMKIQAINSSDNLSLLIGKVGKGKINCGNIMIGLNNTNSISIGNSGAVCDSVYENVYLNDFSLFSASDYTNRVVTGDFNGDGKEDIAALYDYGNDLTKIHVWISTGSAFQYSGDNGWWDSLGGGYRASLATGRVVSGDYNGDGKEDIAALYDYGNDLTKIHVWISTGSAFQYSGDNGWWDSLGGGYRASLATGRVVSGDYNGDGKDDIAALYDYGNDLTKIHVWISTGSAFQYPDYSGWWDSLGGGYRASLVTGRVVSGDYNGDGKDDIAALYDYGNDLTKIHVWISTGSAFQYSGDNGWWDSLGGGYRASLATGRVVSGDYNEDGKDDIAALYDYGSDLTKIHVWISTGTSFQYPNYSGWWNSLAGNYRASLVTGRVVSGDYDGDGKDDIGALYDDGDNLIKVNSWLSNGTLFLLYEWWKSQAIKYQYDTNNRLRSIIKDGVTVLQVDYDANGNLISKHQ